MSETPKTLKKVLRIKRLKEKLPMSSASIYNKLNPRSKYYDETFPRPIRLGMGSVGWLEAEVDDWIATLAQSRSAD